MTCHHYKEINCELCADRERKLAIVECEDALDFYYNVDLPQQEILRQYQEGSSEKVLKRLGLT